MFMYQKHFTKNLFISLNRVAIKVFVEHLIIIINIIMSNQSLNFLVIINLFAIQELIFNYYLENTNRYPKF